MPAEYESDIKLIAERIAGLQDVLDLTDREIADQSGLTVSEYADYKTGTKDFSYTVLFKLSKIFKVDVADLMSGETPRLSSYSVTKAFEGTPVKRREGFTYNTIAATFRGKSFNPLTVYAPYKKSQGEVELSSHEGHEFNFVLSGKLKVIVGGHEEILLPGDSIYYNSETPHGMSPLTEEGCKFLAVLSYL
ncbi:DNA-binding protein [Clostridia bacterium]|nr:DNA-binding protein [Clostridia bacterium]GHV15029.1 DNA-binding protein [Clostridia bacterium]